MVRIKLENYRVRPKERPRAGRGKFYSPSSRREDSLAWLIREQAKGVAPFTSPIAVHLGIYARGQVRGDLDNYEKFVWDALQKSGVIANDRIIKACSCRVFEGSGEDSLEIVVDLLEAELRVVLF